MIPWVEKMQFVVSKHKYNMYAVSSLEVNAWKMYGFLFLIFFVGSGFWHAYLLLCDFIAFN